VGAFLDMGPKFVQFLFEFVGYLSLMDTGRENE
jgi:hypothetical protein